MIKFLFYVVLCLISSSSNALEPSVFKKELSMHAWYQGLGFVFLLFILLVLIKYKRGISTQTSICQLLEKKQLSSKTNLFIFNIDGQKFVLIDNQHALKLQMIHAVSGDKK